EAGVVLIDGGWIEGQPAILAGIQSSGRGFSGRPAIIRLPGVHPGTKGDRFGKSPRALVFELRRQPGSLALGGEVRACPRAELDRAQSIAVTVGPSAMIPRADHQEIVVPGVVLLESFVNLERAVEVFLIPLPCNIQRRDL